MKTRIRKFVSIGLLVAILAASPEFLLAQNSGGRLFGDLTITSNASSASGEEYVTVDRQPAVSGRSIMSVSYTHLTLPTNREV